MVSVFGFEESRHGWQADHGHETFPTLILLAPGNVSNAKSGANRAPSGGNPAHPLVKNLPKMTAQKHRAAI